MIGSPIWGAWTVALAKKGPFHERNQYFLQSPDRSLHDPAASLEAQRENTSRRVWIAKDVPILRIDHAWLKDMLLGVWPAAFRPVLGFKEMNRALFTFYPKRR